MGTPVIKPYGSDSDTRIEGQKPKDTSVNSGEEIDWKKRYEDTQSAYTKQQQKVAELSAENLALKSVGAQPRIEISPEVEAELEDLKYSDPDAWRNRMNEIEAEAMKKHNETFNSTVTQYSEGEKRQIQLEQFNNANGVNITTEMLEYDVPRRFTAELEKGKISYQEYLDKSLDFLKTPKVVGDGNKVEKEPDLGSTGGGESPQKGNEAKEQMAQYGKTTI